MPPDIRSFFGGKGDRVMGKEPQTNKNEPLKGSKPRGRGVSEKYKASSIDLIHELVGKRKVLSDSDDDEAEHNAKKPNKQALATTKEIKRESPVGEVTTSSEYFAGSGKAKPSRSTPLKSKLSSGTGNKNSKTISAKSTPKPKSAPSPNVSNTRTSPRKKSRPDYAIGIDDEDKDSALRPKILEDGQTSGDDIFEAEYKNSRRNATDDYQPDELEDTEVRPIRKGIKHQLQHISVAENGEEGTREKYLNDFPTSSAKRNHGKQAYNEALPKGKKRKTHELDGDEEDDEAENHEGEEEEGEDDFYPSLKKSKHIEGTMKSSIKKSPANKRREDKPKDTSFQKSEVQDILDSIPTIRPPTPPDRSGSKKFDFRGAAQRSQADLATESKEIPTGAENCLAGLTFVFTGLLEALQREEGIELVKRYGGKVTGAPSSKTSYVVLGNDAGPKKLETIAKYNLKVINENGLFELIRRLPPNGGDGKAAEKFEAKKKEEENKVVLLAAEIDKQEKRAAKEAATAMKIGNGNRVASGTSRRENAARIDSRLWTVKYAPTTTSMICGNKTQVDKLQAWLRVWPSNLKTQFRKAGRDGFGVFRAVMIHGPPGIGKTTAAHLAVKLEGYDVVESNASDTRNKRLVETGLKGVLDTTSLLGYFAGDGKDIETEKKKLVLIMDEVDGMSAGDRGGVGALAAACKKTTIPIILICNDRRLPKMKPFDNVTFDLQFKKPTVDQIRSRIMTICYREGLKIPTNVINSLIEGSRSDIRQVINMLSTVKLDQDVMDFDQSKKMSKSWEKQLILKPWDIVNKILGGGMFASNSVSTLNDKIELYFNDHEFSSLMLQENYLATQPILANTCSGREKSLKLLELSDRAAESISDGDLVDRMIHGSQQQWSLMPTHAVFSFVRPASFVAGSLAGNQTRFTSWLGNNSKQGKLMRFLKEIQAHMRLRASGDRHEIRQQYLPLLWYRLVQDLERRGKECVSEIIRLMDSYYLTKDDWDALLELAVGPMAMESVKIDSQTKASFTRLYNVQSHPLPFMKANSIVAPKKSRGDKPDLEEAMDGSDDEDLVLGVGSENVSDDEILDLKKDKYVKQPKKQSVSKASMKKVASKSKEEAKAKDRAGGGDGESGEAEDFRAKKQKGPAKEKVPSLRGRPKK